MVRKGFKTTAAALAAAVMTVSAAASAGGNLSDGFGSMETVYAANFTVTDKNAVLYSNDNTKVYESPDINSKLVTTIAKDLPVNVTGITSNGWFRISLEGTYYVPGNGLEQREIAAAGAALNGTNIQKLTQGTFSFYKNQELSDFDVDDVEDMDANTYLKYMDSYLMGYAIMDDCILQSTGYTLKTTYDSLSKTDAKVAAMTMQMYLINYRNEYLSDSLAGPFRSEKDLKLAMNRAIRYDIKTFGTIYKSASIGSDETKMKKHMEKIVSEIKAEQGVSFTCRMEYGNYKYHDGSETKGWIIEFTKKD